MGRGTEGLADAALLRGGCRSDALVHHRSPHVARRTDARFASLASQPYEALADSERVWLVAESAAQVAMREAGVGQGNRGGGALVVGLLVGVVGGALLIGYAFSQAFP